MSRMVLEWFREVPNGLGSVRNGFGIYGRFWKVRKVQNIMAGSRRVRDDPGYLRESGRFHSRCNHVALMVKAFA